MPEIVQRCREGGEWCDGPRLPALGSRLHPTGRDGLRRTRHAQARHWVDNGNGTASPGCRRLVELQWRRDGRRHKGGGIGVERKARLGSHGVRLGRSLGGATGQRRAVRGCRVDRDHVTLGEQGRAELEVVVEIKRALQLKAMAETRHGCRLFLAARGPNRSMSMVLGVPRSSLSPPRVMCCGGNGVNTGHTRCMCWVVIVGGHDGMW